MIKRTVCIIAVTLSLCMLGILTSSAELFTEKTGGGRADSIYVAGVTDLYPIEYYDSDTYKGLIPDMLSIVSEQTGIDFTYISAGKDMQKSLYDNGQVELVTAIMSDDADFKDMEKLAVLTVQSGDTAVSYCIGFTEVISDESKSAIIAALNGIPESQRAAFLVEHAKADLLAAQKKFAFTVTAAIVVVSLAAVVVIIAVVRRKRLAAKLDRMIDRNTGIGNAVYYTYVFDNLISEQSKNLYNLAYFAFDTRSFEENGSSVSVGDIERYAASRLNHYASAAEYISRVDDGAFVFLFQADNEYSAEKRVADILIGINKYIAEFVPSCNSLFKAGYCRFYEHMGTNAESALFNAKQGYLYAQSNSMAYHIGSKALADENKKSAALSLQIDSALKNGEFKTYMQFIADGKTGRFCGAEVLSRWQNSEYGLLRPYEYIAILGKTGKIVEHDYFVFENVCRQLELWSEPPFGDLFLTCNFTRLSVSKSDFSDRLDSIASRYSFLRSRLVIEITEDSLSVNSETVSENIARLTDLGFKVAIDDMGTGFSSFADIYDNEIDIVKIERNFVVSCVNERRRQMLSDIISLVHNAGAQVICEGIETSEQLEMLKGLSCDMVQGFYHSRVLPLTECERFFLSNEAKINQAKL